MYPPENKFSIDIYHIGVLVALLVALWYIVSWYFGCGIIPVPFSCDTYWNIARFSEGGKARVLIVYGDGGLGDHELLRQTLSNPSKIIAPAYALHISGVTLGNLKDYDLVIVEEARKLSTDDLQMFMDYARGGGRLVWTGDAGTVLDDGDKLLFEFERPNGSDENKVVSPWSRKDGAKVVAFDSFLGLDYVGNFCELKTCPDVPQIGIFSAPNRSHELVKAINPNLRMFGDFSIVKVRSSSYTTSVLSVDALSNIIADHDVYSGTTPVNEVPQCRDNLDNDGDGFIDFGGLDLDHDGLPEIERDPGCNSLQDDYEGVDILSSPKDFKCDDNKDNDNDGLIDYPNDDCCLSRYWNNEDSCISNSTECSDGQDNDNDGFIDYPSDGACYSSSADSEGSNDLGRVFPIIVTAGLGQKVAYYAVPPEFFVSNKMPIDSQTGIRISYPSLVENMYYGMIK